MISDLFAGVVTAAQAKHRNDMSPICSEAAALWQEG